MQRRDLRPLVRGRWGAAWPAHTCLPHEATWDLPSAGDRMAGQEMLVVSHRIPPTDWVGALREFTRRNAGRNALLEVDAPELGAQRSGQDLPLRGVSYDPRDRRVEMMLGEMGLPGSHLTHSIGEVAEIDLLVGEDGRDRVLRVGAAGGQTLLRLGSG